MSFLISTVPIPNIRNLNIYDIGTTTMRVRWEAAQGATGYQLLYEPVNATVPSTEKEVRNVASPANPNKISAFVAYDNVLKEVFFMRLLYISQYYSAMRKS